LNEGVVLTTGSDLPLHDFQKYKPTVTGKRKHPGSAEVTVPGANRERGFPKFHWDIDKGIAVAKQIAQVLFTNGDFPTREQFQRCNYGRLYEKIISNAFKVSATNFARKCDLRLIQQNNPKPK